MTIVEQQRYIEALRADAKASAMRHEIELVERDAEIGELKVNRAIISTVWFSICMGLLYGLYIQAIEIQALTEARTADTGLQQRFDNAVEDWQYQSKQATDLALQLEECKAEGVK